MNSGLAKLRQRAPRPRNRNLHRAIFLPLLFAVALQLVAQSSLVEKAANETDAGDYDAAIRDAQQAAVFFERKGDRTNRTIALNQAGLAQLYAAQYAPARASFELALRVAIDNRDHEGQVEEWMNLASVDFYTGRYSDAAAHYAAAAKVLDANPNTEWTPRRRRILLANEATLDQRLGRYDKALAAYQRALADTHDVQPDEHAQMLVNLGVVYRRLGDPYKALAAYDEALKLFAQSHQLDGELGVLKNRGIVLALDLGRLAEARAAFAQARARAEQAGSRREALQAQLYGAETSLRMGDAADAGRDFRAAYEAARALETVEDQWKALYGLARCEQQLGDERAAAQHLRDAIAIIENIREAIRITSLKSDFFNDKRQVFDALIGLRLRRGAGAEELFHLIERGHSRGWRDRLGLRGDVTLAAVQRALPADAVMLDYWASSAVVTITRSSARVQTISADRLVPPLPALPHLIVVTGGVLASIPFELQKDGSRMLIESHDVTYMPTAAMLLRPAAPVRRYAPPWTTQFRGFAGPGLPGSVREVRDIASELGGRALLYIGRDDRKSELLRTAAVPVVHIASHAFVDPNAIEQSRILFSGDYLFLKEAYELPFRDVELAVLSACDTERGRVTAGEGIESFSRAFLAAGAKSTVTTLWRVPDETTAAFMRLFYHHLQRGVSRAEALRLTKLRFKQSGADSRDWAAFVLTGDGLRPISTAIRWQTVMLIAFTIVAVGVIVRLALTRA